MDTFIDQSCPDLLRGKVQIATNDASELLSCSLNLTDVVNNANKFFIMQTLKNKDGAYFVVLRSGRLGSKGINKIECFLDKDLAEKEFTNQFYERTGLKWEQRNNDPVAGKYTFIEMKYQSLEENVEDIINKSDEITLDPEVIKLVELLFNKKLYEEMAAKYNLDTKRAPLGAVSKTQINKAYAVLSKLSEKDQKDIAHLTSQFYSLIPTCSGMTAPPLLDNKTLIKEKMDLLKDLEDVDILSNLIKKQKVSAKGTPLYKNYHSLNAEISLLKDSSTRKLIADYLYQTSANHYRLKLHQIYEIEREQDKTSYRRWMSLHNRQLLWHGSGMINYASIISKGLRINPAANVYITGKMFGNGIYFANCSTKSAQYMRADRNGIGALLLCEVALGTPEVLTKSNTNLKRASSGHHSVHGAGYNTPDKNDYVTLPDGVIVPVGRLVSNEKLHNSKLKYDEFIVYNETQTRLRYLVLVNIN